jgi:hypothetical protein
MDREFKSGRHHVKTSFEMDSSARQVLWKFLDKYEIIEPVDSEGNKLEDISFNVEVGLVNEKGKWLVRLWPFSRPVGGYEFGANVSGTAYSDRLEIETEGDYEREAKFICFYRQKPAE